MTLEATEQKIEQHYHVSWFIVAYKFLFGLSELVLGIGIVMFGKAALVSYRQYVAQQLLEDPHDLLVRLTSNVVPNVLAHHTFLVFYLISLGSAKVAGAIGLMFGRNWGVDLLVGLTLLMFPFQFIQLLLHPSLADFLYIFIGLFIALYLINFKPHEWVFRRKRRLQSLVIEFLATHDLH